MRDIRDFDYFLIYTDYIQPIKMGWRIIIFASILGLIATLFYVLTLPNNVEVVAQIKMPRFSLGGPLGNNVELPKEPIKRINLSPDFHGWDYLCGSHSNNKNLDATFEMFLAQKNKNSLVEVSFYQDSEDLARACLSGLLSAINKSQLIIFNDLKNQFIYKNLVRVDKNKMRLLEDKRILARLDSNKDAYEVEFKLIERIRKLEDLLEIDILEGKEINYEEAQYVDKSIIFKSPNRASKKFLILLIGLISSSFLGILFILIRHKIIVTIKNFKEVEKIGD